MHAMKITGFAFALSLALGAAMPAQAAISAQLAKQCRAMMLKAHPIEVFGEQGSAAAQRAYFQQCVSRQGNMPDARPAGRPQPGTTGEGSRD